MKSRLLFVFMTAVFILMMTTVVSFAEEECTITIKKPAEEYTAYAGENIAYEFDLQNNRTGEKDYIWPWIRVFDTKKDWSDYTHIDSLAWPSATRTYSDSVVLYKGYPAGEYHFRVIAVPLDENGDAAVDVTKKNFEKDLPKETVKIKIKTLFWPESLRLTASKGKIKVTYSKVKGATGYEIYRSTKAKSGFKSIGTTTKTSFVDKKVKKGKKYFYYVKSVRDKHGLIRSQPGPKAKMKAK